MIRIEIGYVWSDIFVDDPVAIEALKKELSYTNTQAAYQLFRWKKSKFAIERRVYEKHGYLPETFIASQKQRLAELEAKAHPVCWEAIEGGLRTYTGLIERVRKFLERLGHQVQLTDHRSFEFERKEFPSDPKIRLREPQQVVLNKVVSGEWGDVKGWGLVCLATGVGKTLTAQTVIQHLGGKTLFLAPSRSILDQTAKRFQRAFGPQNVGVYGDGKKQRAWITVGTYQSVALADDGEFDDVSVLVEDECHRVPSETFFKSRMKVRKALYCIGLSATPYRNDGADKMIEAGAGAILYDYPIQKAIAAGYLAKPTFVIYEISSTGGQFERFKTKKVKGKTTRVSLGFEDAKPYNGKELDEAYNHWMVGNDRLNQFVAMMAQEEARNGGSALILIDELKHGDALKKLLPEAGYATGGDKDNEALQEAFNAKKLGVLLGSSCLAEGSDLIPVSLMFDMVGGLSEGQLMQRIGRALRNDEDENGVPRKPRVIVCDFDFVNCKILHKHALAREKILSKIGDVHRVKLF